ncbi:hypothetical protein OMAG_000301 [Candidatus Omnitrophus magneticus]|uniref:Uncharacterized protein n=1 Tax=Candidatus Omnitrophus magneticus TaxID=1609969 RepID=A0A0F0CW87_9BACT|nr:hypothetical protein OMAG_000301 [Candidatus Omnitrophus magneticus]
MLSFLSFPRKRESIRVLNFKKIHGIFSKIFIPVSGISLVEVIVSIGIITLISVSVLVTMSHSVTFSSKADIIFTAALVAERRIDVLKKFSFNALSSSASETDTGVDVNEDGDNDFLRSTEITENYDGYLELIKVKVSVSRLESGKKKGAPIVMETLFSNVEA